MEAVYYEAAGTFIGILLVVLSAGILFLLLRRLMLWYWKIDAFMALAVRMEAHLAKLAGEPPPPPLAKPKPMDPRLSAALAILGALALVVLGSLAIGWLWRH